jgi:hypothetical protein
VGLVLVLDEPADTPTMAFGYGSLDLFRASGKGVHLGEQVPGLGCADPLEYLQCPPQQDLSERLVIRWAG